MPAVRALSKENENKKQLKDIKQREEVTEKPNLSIKNQRATLIGKQSTQATQSSKTQTKKIKKNSKGETQLHLAVMKVNIVFRNKFYVKLNQFIKTFLLIFNFYQNNLNLVKEILKESTLEIDIRDNAGWTPLVIKSEHCMHDVQYLINY
jgi:ankyrin repeat protein